MAEQKNIMSYETVALDDEQSALVILDQTKLPYEVEVLHLTEQKDIWDAIYLLKVRGAPAIGIFAAYSMAVLAAGIDAPDFDALDLSLLAEVKRNDKGTVEVKLIDRIRWSHLDDLECGHDFDFAGLCVYRCKLAILEKYRERKAEQGRENFNRAVERISSAAGAAQE